MILALVLMGCRPASIFFDDKPGDTSGIETGGDDTADTADSADSGSETGDSSDTSNDTADTGAPPGPCTDGSWGNAAESSIIVLSGADDRVADGTMDAPFGTIPAALAYSFTTSNANVLIAPGSYEVNLEIYSDNNGLVLVGCGSDQTFLQGATSSADTVYMSGASVTMMDLAVQYGDNGITVDTGTVNLNRVTVLDSLERGTYVKNGGALGIGDSTIVSTGTFGIAVESEGTAVVYQTSITGANAAGVYISGGYFVGGSLAITDTQGTPGFGAYVGEYGSFAVEEITISGGSVAGVMAYNASTVSLTSVIVSNIAAIDSTVEPQYQHSDGVVFGLGEDSDPSAYNLLVDGLDVSDVGRSALIADGITLQTLQGVSSATGYSVSESSVFLQGGTVVVDTAPNPYVTLVEGEELDWSWSW